MQKNKESKSKILKTSSGLKSQIRDLKNQLEKKRNTETELQKSYYDLEMSKLATLNLLEDIKIEMNQRQEAEELNRRRSEELRISEEKFKNVFEFAPVGKSLTSCDGIMSVNKAFCNLLGFTKKEMKNMNWRVITHPEDIERNEEIINSILRGTKRTVRWEKRFIHKNGEIIWVDISTTLLKDSEGNPMYFITTIIDITEKKEGEEKIVQLNLELEKRVKDRTAQLENANKELEAFAYSVSHDLRAPLRAIDGFSKFVLEDFGSNLEPEGKRLLELIRNNTQKMDHLITDILALSRVSRSEHKISRIEMAKMAISMYNECVAIDDQHKLKFIIDDMPDTYGDPTYLKQVWTNLISNAIKFSSGKNKPEINVGGYYKNGFNIYYVKDNGVGFNSVYAHKLFHVFQRLHKSDEFEGTGIGLAIVQRIIHRHGGNVWAEGTEGSGAVFYFSIPVN